MPYNIWTNLTFCYRPNNCGTISMLLNIKVRIYIKEPKLFCLDELTNNIEHLQYKIKKM